MSCASHEQAQDHAWWNPSAARSARATPREDSAGPGKVLGDGVAGHGWKAGVKPVLPVPGLASTVPLPVPLLVMLIACLVHQLLRPAVLSE